MMSHDQTELAPAVWRILAQNFAEAFYVLRFEEPLNALDGGQWSTLLWITSSWIRGDTSPSQRTLATLSGLSPRTLRRNLGVFEELELLRGVRASGSTTDLEVGPRLARIFRDFASCRDPKIWTRPTPANRTLGPAGTTVTVAEVSDLTPANRALGPAGTTAGVPEVVTRIPAKTAESALTPATVAEVGGLLAPLIKKNKDLSSFSSEGGPTPATPAAPGQHVDAATARRLALDALAAYFVRANPGIPLPRACDAGDVRLVEACTAGGTWEVEKLRQAHLDAIDGAFEKAPPDRAPTPRYIWGQYRFFLAHAAIGRAKRLRAETPPKPKKPRPPEDPPASTEWLAEHMRVALTRLDTIPDVARPKPPPRFRGDSE
jgi:hypothetical protein